DADGGRGGGTVERQVVNRDLVRVADGDQGAAGRALEHDAQFGPDHLQPVLGDGELLVVAVGGGVDLDRVVVARRGDGLRDGEELVAAVAVDGQCGGHPPLLQRLDAELPADRSAGGGGSSRRHQLPQGRDKHRTSPRTGDGYSGTLNRH